MAGNGIKTLMNLAAGIPDHSLPDSLRINYYRGLKSAGRKVWSGMLRVAASGFGKGALLTGGIILAASGLYMGLAAYAGELPAVMGSLGYAAPTVGEGIMMGLGNGINFLMNSFTGVVMLMAGGALGAVSEVRQEQNKMNASMAQAEAQYFENMRQQQMSVEPEREQAIAEQKEESFLMRELNRREQGSTGPGLGAR